jgi:hypothetical protein
MAGQRLLTKVEDHFYVIVGSGLLQNSAKGSVGGF